MVVGALSRLEPGGWGAFLALARSPTNPMLWLAGADVGGLFVSRNDGRDWASCGRTLPTLWIMAIMFTEDGLPVVGTSAGVWCAVPTESSHSCGDWDLAPCNDGLRSSNASLALATSGFEFSHPVRALALDDTSIWAGVGIQLYCKGGTNGESIAQGHCLLRMMHSHQQNLMAMALYAMMLNSPRLNMK